MSDRIFGTNKVDNIIGLRDQVVYDSIDVYVDITNNDNLWAIVHSTEYMNHKPIKKDEIVHFLNNHQMRDYVSKHFGDYELTHPVDINYKHLFFHYVDYSKIEYFSHNGRPDLNYIEIKYYEIENKLPMLKRMRFPKEYEDFFKLIFKVSKKIPDNLYLGPTYHKDIDVYEEKDDIRRERLHNAKESIKDFGFTIKDKVKNIEVSPKLFKGLKIMISTVALGSLLAGGFNLVMDNIYNSEFIKQDNPIRNAEDVSIYANKGKAGVIIEKLLHSKYDEVSPDELKFVTSYIKSASESNFDNNDSFNTFRYTDYFMYEVGGEERNGISADILKKIDSLYSSCFYNDNGRMVINETNASKYIDYVGSLTFLYDTYHSDKQSYVNTFDTQSIISPYATSSEITVYDNYPPILRYIILVQLKGLLQRSDYELKVRPSYYFKGTDKYDLLNEVSNRVGSTLDELYFQCGYNYRAKSI